MVGYTEYFIFGFVGLMISLLLCVMLKGMSRCIVLVLLFSGCVFCAQRAITGYLAGDMILATRAFGTMISFASLGLLILQQMIMDGRRQPAQPHS